MLGWIKLHRKIKDHWLYPKGRPFTEYEAFLDLLLNVNYVKGKSKIGNDFVDVLPGESTKSLENWSQRWHWHKSRAQRFLKTLQKDNIITKRNSRKLTTKGESGADTEIDTKTDTGTDIKVNQRSTHLSLLNWDTYQIDRIDAESYLNLSRIDTESKLNLIKEVKERKEKDKKERVFLNNPKEEKNSQEIISDDPTLLREPKIENFFSDSAGNRNFVFETLKPFFSEGQINSVIQLCPKITQKYLDEKITILKNRAPKNPAAFLYAAITQNYIPTEGDLKTTPAPNDPPEHKLIIQAKKTPISEEDFQTLPDNLKSKFQKNQHIVPDHTLFELISKPNGSKQPLNVIEKAIFENIEQGDTIKEIEFNKLPSKFKSCFKILKVPMREISKYHLC